MTVSETASSSVFGLLTDVIEGGAATIKDPRVDQLEGVVDRIATEWVLDESLERWKVARPDESSDFCLEPGYLSSCID